MLHVLDNETPVNEERRAGIGAHEPMDEPIDHRIPEMRERTLAMTGVASHGSREAEANVIDRARPCHEHAAQAEVGVRQEAIRPAKVRAWRPRGGNLSYTDLGSANLMGADIRAARFESATFCNTKMPSQEMNQSGC